MSDKKQTPAPQPAAHSKAQSVKDIPLEERLPEDLQPLYRWWKANGNVASTALCVGALLFAGYTWHNREQSRKAALAGGAIREARNLPPDRRTEQLEDIVAKYGATKPGRHASLELAAALFADERYDEALALCQKFAKSNSSSPFLFQARDGEAACLEALGKYDGAASANEALLASLPAGHYLRPQVELRRARLIMLKGDKAAALLALEETGARYAGTDWEPRVEEMRGVIERHVPRAPRPKLSATERLNLLGFGDALKSSNIAEFDDEEDGDDENDGGDAEDDDVILIDEIPDVDPVDETP